MQILQKIRDDVSGKVVNQIEQALPVCTLLPPTIESVLKQTTAPYYLSSNVSLSLTWASIALDIS